MKIFEEGYNQVEVSGDPLSDRMEGRAALGKRAPLSSGQLPHNRARCMAIQRPDPE